jgi:hypothetical protein
MEQVWGYKIEISKVYARRKFRSQQETTELVQTTTFEQCPTPGHESEQEIIDISSALEIDVENPSLDDIPIALQEGT